MLAPCPKYQVSEGISSSRIKLNCVELIKIAQIKET